jgi:hypothetical protein
LRGAQHIQETVTGGFVLVEGQTALRLTITSAPLTFHPFSHRKHKAAELAEWNDGPMLAEPDNQAIAGHPP